MRYQSYAYGLNHWSEDRDLQVILSHYWPSWREYAADLETFGALAGSDVYEGIYHIDHDAPPVLVMHDLDGRRVDRVRLSPVETQLLKAIAPMNRAPYEGGGWHHYYALGYLLADPGLYCVMTITGQTAYTIHKYAPSHATWKEKLLAGEMFGATWMTENQGGSDLGANTTAARPDGEVWRLTGDKYFASGAGLTDVALVTARPQGAPAGPKGLALFLVPRLNRAGELNYRVRRLKDKSATRAVPSGEVELDNSEAYLVDRAEEGIYYTLENLTVSRLANAVAGMGIAKKAHLEVMERVRRRHSFGRALQDHPLVRRDLVDMAVRLVGGTALAFHAVGAFQRAWHERPPYTPAYHYARFLSHLAKNRTADHAAEVTRLGMELFGGLGFLEEYAVARWHREALITPIWEGPSNIQALDLLETVQKKRAHEGFLSEFIPMLERVGTTEAQWAREAIEKVFAGTVGLNPEELQWYAKHWVIQLADAAQVALLYQLAETGGERYSQLATLYAHRFLRGEEYPSWAMREPRVWGGAV